MVNDARMMRWLLNTGSTQGTARKFGLRYKAKDITRKFFNYISESSKVVLRNAIQLTKGPLKYSIQCVRVSSTQYHNSTYRRLRISSHSLLVRSPG